MIAVGTVFVITGNTLLWQLPSTSRHDIWKFALALGSSNIASPLLYVAPALQSKHTTREAQVGKLSPTIPTPHFTNRCFVLCILKGRGQGIRRVAMSVGSILGSLWPATSNHINLFFGFIVAVACSSLVMQMIMWKKLAVTGPRKPAAARGLEGSEKPSIN